MHLAVERTLGLANVMEFFLKGMGVHRGALCASYIAHKKRVKRCFEGQMKKHLESYVLDEGIPTAFFFQMSKRCFINLSKCQRGIPGAQEKRCYNTLLRISTVGNLLKWSTG